MSKKVPGTLAGAAVAVLTSFAVPAGAGTPAGTGWTAPLDDYCERLGIGLWAEPLNASSNAAFLIAAGVILLRQRRAGGSIAP